MGNIKCLCIKSHCVNIYKSNNIKSSNYKIRMSYEIKQTVMHLFHNIQPHGPRVHLALITVQKVNTPTNGRGVAQNLESRTRGSIENVRKQYVPFFGDFPAVRPENLTILKVHFVLLN